MQGIAVPISVVPGNSPIHRINPIPKMVWVLGILVISFITRNPVILGGVFLLGLLFVTIAQIWPSYLRVVMVLFPISLTLILLQSIAPAFPQPWTPIVAVGPFTIWQEGIYSGLSLLLRIMCMTTFAMVMIMTSHPSDIFASMQKVGLPYTMNFILTMTLQLIPILQSEFNTVLKAQKSRGLKGTGFAAILPSMVPVFVGAIERVQQLSISLESRAFGSSGQKTSYRQVQFGFKDALVLAAGALFSGAMTYWLLVDKTLDWSRTLTFSPTFALILFFGAGIGFLLFIAFALRLVLTA
ncbi:MAG: energy-coupling factor transporter transmembrane protein EcfT [Anaerolineales bacterium]|nr:energy-coupling factor transporter transmembrane protein EcfT [Anaerolineales bacterium]MCW5854843.1 energy-coupling factor transporter transmembrane protein EcfT [Anaerolineales bacterium]